MAAGTKPRAITTRFKKLRRHSTYPCTLDHSGFIPVLYKKGFRGPVFTHQATISLCAILLPDSGHIQEDDAKFYGKHKISRHENPEPLYDKATAEACLSLFQSVAFDENFSIGDIDIVLQSAGHILGAASVLLRADGKRVGFSGDVGRHSDIIMYPPKSLPPLDLLLLESTYGNRLHDKEDPLEQLAEIVNSTAKKGGALLIPSFAVGRTEAVQHMLATLIKDKRIPKLPVYLDSPMAISVFDIYCQHFDLNRLSNEQCHEMCNVATFTRTVDESKALAELIMPHIIIAGSGMATGGRILHHMKRLLGDYRTTILFTGHLSGGTRGAKMLAGKDSVKIHGKWLPVKASVEVLSGLSGHGDYEEITQWLLSSQLHRKTKICLVHGEPEASEAMRDHLMQNTQFDVEVACYHEILRL
jgi:metallo-beta-lactamase family protein